MQGAYQPGPIAQVGRNIEPEFAPENDQCLWGRALAQNRRGHITREDLRANKNQDRHRKQGQNPE